jgi:hypothetical protein
MSIPRNHHIVPRGYLKRLVRPDTSVHYAWKKNRIISDTSAKKLCSEIDGYRLVTVHPDDALLLETNYKNLWEDHYDEVFSTLTNDNITAIDDKLRTLVIGTVCSLLFRSQRLKNTINDFHRRLIESSVNMRFKDGTKPKTFELDGKIFELEGKTADDLWTEYSAGVNDDELLVTQFAMGVRLQQVRSRDAISITRVHGTTGFITSDNPTRIHPSVPGIVAPFNTTDVLTLPLNEEYRIELVPGLPNVDQHRIYRTNLSGQEALDEVADNNHRQFVEAEKIIIGRRAALESFISTEPMPPNPQA